MCFTVGVLQESLCETKRLTAITQQEIVVRNSNNEFIHKTFISVPLLVFSYSLIHQTNRSGLPPIIEATDEKGHVNKSD